MTYDIELSKMGRWLLLTSRSMKIIFIRHGQTDENVAHRHQPSDTPLSVVGRRQAVEAAARLSECEPTHIVSSPMIRALQTASLIADKFDLIPSIDYSIRELERPQFLTGHKHFSFRSLLFYKFWFLGFSQGGEAYRTLRARTTTARENLEKLPKDAVVLVVSHTVFLNLFIAHLRSTRPLWPWQALLVFWKIIRMKNTGMIELTYEEGRWQRTSDLSL